MTPPSGAAIIPSPAMKILFIEDDVETVAYVTRSFKDHGHIVEHHAAARRALIVKSRPTLTPPAIQVCG
jgi:hypothetical protein